MQYSDKLYLRKRNNGYYYIGYFTNGKLRWKTTKSCDKRKALTKLTRFKEFTEEASKPKLLSQFIVSFMEFVEKTYNPKTIPMFRKALSHLTTITGDLRIIDITAEHADLYKIKRAA